MSPPLKIDALYAWIATDSRGGEGIPALSTPLGEMPMIGADRDRIESLRPHAMKVAGQGYTVRLVAFACVGTLETLPRAPVIPPDH